MSKYSTLNCQRIGHCANNCNPVILCFTERLEGLFRAIYFAEMILETCVASHNLSGCTVQVHGDPSHNSLIRSNCLENLSLHIMLNILGGFSFRSNCLENLSLHTMLNILGGFSFRSNFLENLSLHTMLNILGGFSFRSNCLENLSLHTMLNILGGFRI